MYEQNTYMGRNMTTEMNNAKLSLLSLNPEALSFKKKNNFCVCTLENFHRWFINHAKVSSYCIKVNFILHA